MSSFSRSVVKDTLAISRGIDKINEEISFWEKVSKKHKAVKNRLERLYTAKRQLTERPEDSNKLVQQLKEINES